ncbi:YVTN repeat-like/Quino protein amine dehydrogenase [Hyaloscypha variabilis F]|uniref:YVTN repeat-like/Quino protein amine dehydrogenase n=1 Tax=Hyaloscypha variabilis (strain UAMH 11265 / GT02V1 / F) TaxID=1149755 RepID=A0A2J6RUD6_HYAVF|nr:YVTN repeat-like/Quino protein amine dehydrogenase [Hyaloscypha variabilis F]
MRLLQRTAGGFSPTKDFVGDDIIPPYAILSHTWGDEEVTYRDLIDGTGATKAGWDKIRFCGHQAERDGLQYFWIDTCCIDKSNLVELQEAINSMFRWYQNAIRCYVYLSDVSAATRENDSVGFAWEPALRTSRWFTRGWTLQELLAPRSVEFFSQEGNRLGNKKTLERQIHEITGIAVSALQGTPLSEFSINERLSWAKGRQTTRKEDKAYSLCGIFDVFVPLMYGEGEEKALVRVREEIHKPIKTSTGADDPINRLDFAAEAPFNSLFHQHETNCLPETRVELLQEIYNWADGEDKRCIFWLNGLAGTGKSTIARTVARRYSEKGRLAASFFFSKDIEDVRHAGKFATSIAVQLAQNVPALHKHISEAAGERKDLTRQSLRDQWTHLVRNPLSKLVAGGRSSSYVLVVDALDECDDDNSIAMIIQLLGEAASLAETSSGIRIFLTSRPEITIRCGISQVPATKHHNVVLHNISLSIVDNDISLFFQHELGRISQEHCLDDGWPGTDVVAALVRKASGLFIWAATACRFVREGLFAEERLLELVEGGTTDVSSSPTAHLDRIYTTVLRSAVPASFTTREKAQFYGMLKDILGSVVVLLSTFSVESWSELLRIPKPRIDRMLRDFHAILDVPEDQTRRLRLHHPSFRDFLLDRERCGDADLWVDEKQAHRTLAVRCIQQMSAFLKKDICAVHTPGTLVSDIQKTRLDHYLPPEVQYACVYWIHHLEKSGAVLGDPTYDFLKKHFLHWFEALAWAGKVSEGIHAVYSLESITANSECSDLHAFVLDMKRFMLYSRPIIEHAPLQVYYSALLFAPTRSRVRNQFKDSMLQYLRRIPDVKRDWDALLQTFEVDSASTKDEIEVNNIAFSPDGKMLASASKNGLVKLWNAGTGAELHMFTESLSALAFSPDSKILALASRKEKMIKLRDTTTGAEVRVLEGNWDSSSGQPKAMAFSEDGKTLTLALKSGTALRWDASTGALQQSLENLDRPISVVALSSDGKLLASWSDSDETVELWDTSTKVKLHILEGQLHILEEHEFFDSFAVMAFSRDSKVLGLVLYSEPIPDRARVSLFDTATGEILYENYSDPAKDISFSPDGTVMALAMIGKIELRDTSTGATKQKFSADHWANAVAFSPDGKMLASAWYYGMVRLWDTSATTMQEDRLHRVYRMAFSPDGKIVATSWHSRMIQLWYASTGKTREIFDDRLSHFDVAFSPNGKMLASTFDSNTVKILSPDKGEVLHVFRGDSEFEVSFSTDSRVLALLSGKDRKIINLWDTTTGALLRRLKGHKSSVGATTFSLDGKILASASRSPHPTVKIWNTDTGTELKTLKSLSNTVWAMALSPDAKILALVLETATMLWDTSTGTALHTLGHSNLTKTVAFSPDSKFVATTTGSGWSTSAPAGCEKAVFLWDSMTGVLIQTLRVESVVRYLSFSEDGTFLDTDKGAWPITPFHLLEGASREKFAREIFAKNQWITIGGENILWLPHDYWSDYRTDRVTVRGGNVVLISKSDSMVVLEFIL